MKNWFKTLFYRYIYCPHYHTEWTTDIDLACIDCERILRHSTDLIL